MRIGDGVRAINAELLHSDGDYILVDAWTTIDGQWYVSGSPYSVPQWAVDDYAIAGELGGNQHLYVRVLDENGHVNLNASVVFKNNDMVQTREVERKDGFANLPVWNIFYPDQGQNGGWETGVVVPENTAFGLQGGGLPYALHVSLFTVYQKKIPNGGNGNGNGSGENHMEVTVPRKNTTIHIHTNGHDFNMEVTDE